MITIDESYKNKRFFGWRRTIVGFNKHKFLFLLMLPGILYFIIFRYAPIYGVLMAFKDLDITKGITNSPWAEPFYKYFVYALQTGGALRVVKNTIIISMLKLIIVFPTPIIFALLLNELKNMIFKKIVQTISYLPFFISWVVVASLITMLLSPSVGPYGFFMNKLGLQSTVLLADPTSFLVILILSDIWKGVGWSSVIYIATISNIDQEQYQSAIIDGASRFKQAVHITLPGMVPVITILFILSLGNILNAGFDQIFNLYNPSVYRVADIIDTFVYRMGLASAEYSMTTAIGLLKNIVAFALVLASNSIVRRFSEYTLW